MEEHWCTACNRKVEFEVLERTKIYYGWRVKRECPEGHFVSEHRKH